MLDYRFSFKNINKPYIIWIVYLLDSCFTCKLLLACMQGKNTKGLLLDCQIVSWDIYDLWSFDSTFQTWYFICQLCHTIYSITFLSALLIILYQVITIHFIKTKKLSRLLNDSFSRSAFSRLFWHCLDLAWDFHHILFASYFQNSIVLQQTNKQWADPPVLSPTIYIFIKVETQYGCCPVNPHTLFPVRMIVFVCLVVCVWVKLNQMLLAAAVGLISGNICWENVYVE